VNVVDQSVRERVLDARGTCLHVEAGAGTGKTTLLVERVLRRLEDGVPLPRLAVITFTKKAAAELVARLRRRLTIAREGGAGWAAGALDDFDRAQVGTTDSFCRALLADFPFEANVPPGFSIADDVAQQALEEVAWSRHLERSADASARLFLRLREAAVALDRLQRVSLELLSNRDLAPSPSDAPEPFDLVERLVPCMTEALDLRRFAKDPNDKLKLWLDDLERDWSVARALPSPVAERALLTREKFSAGRLGKTTAWFGGPTKERIVSALAQADEIRAEFLRARGAALASETRTWIEGFLAEYERVKRERGLLDFRDLALATRDLLQRDERVRARIANRFDEILLDEAQDTDPLQMEIAFLLAADGTPPLDPFDASLRPGSLFLVGDPKQSIYRFRRADIELYEAAAARLAQAGESHAIQTNFRSHPQILSFVNRVFDGWMQRAEGERFQARYVPLAAGREDTAAGDARVALLLPDPATWRDRPRRRNGALAASDRLEVEVDAVVRLVRKVLGEDGGPAWGVVDAGAGGERPARAEDVAVLVRKIGWGDRLLEALRSQGIAASVTGGRRFWAREEIETLLALLESILDPRDRFARFAALRSSALAFSDDELVLRFLGDDPDTDESLAELRRVERRLDELASAARAMSVPEFLEMLCEDLALLTIFGLRPDGPARMESLRILVESAENLADAGLDTLPAFVRWLREQSSESREGGLGDEGASGDEGVIVSTIHQSKGLEYPIVILADLASGTPSDALVAFDRAGGRAEFRLSKRAGVETPGFEDALARDRVREAAEEVRLLYVAMTRARDHLVISWPEGSGGFVAGKENELIRRIGCAPGIEAPADSDLRTIRAAELPALAGTGRTIPIDADEVPAVAARARPSIDAARRGRRVIPATRFAPTAAVSLPADRARLGAAFGNWIHRALELHRPGDAPPLALDAARATVERRIARDEPEFAFDGALRDHAARMFARIVADPALAAVWRAPNVQREVPFLLPIGDDFVSGTLDVLVLGSDGRLAVVDYKTEDLGGASAERAKERYRSQALVYAHAASRLGGRPVSEVRFLFLASDPVGVGSFLVDDEFLLEARSVLGRAALR